jgi:hypothetical protein
MYGWVGGHVTRLGWAAAMRSRKESKEWRDIDLGTPSDFNTERLDRFQAPQKRKAPWNRTLGMARPAPSHPRHNNNTHCVGCKC